MPAALRLFVCSLFFIAGWPSATTAQVSDSLVETLPALEAGKAPTDLDGMWHGFDPRAEPLEIETLHEWEEEDVILRVIRFRIGVFKGQKAWLAAIYGFPKTSTGGRKQIPGLVQIHGGGQFADHKACLTNAKRGYATISIAWAGRISAPGYRVNSDIVKLFWEGESDNPAYRVTTDWGAVDGYHAPSRNPGNVFPSAKAGSWTLDSVESPRNSGWFLCALAARRALTFLEQQPEVDPNRLGVYGHSMGGKLTVMTAIDERVKAAAPSCGGITDRDNSSSIFRSTLGDDVSLRRVQCPIIFLSPSNDFHGRISDLASAVDEIRSPEWRVTCSPHHNHQDTPAYEVATLLWFDEHLKGSFVIPETPQTRLLLETKNRVPRLQVTLDDSRKVLSIDVYYTQHGKEDERNADREITMNRFWHHAPLHKIGNQWEASLPISNTDKPLWAYANVLYSLDNEFSGAGYYYRIYKTSSFNLSSLLQTASPSELKAAGVLATLQTSTTLEDFGGDWEKEWFTYRPEEWARSTHKVHAEAFQAPTGAQLAFEIQAAESNELVVSLDEYAAVVTVVGGANWQQVSLSASDFQNHGGEALPNWDSIKRLTLGPTERLRPARGAEVQEDRILGGAWKGTPPAFQNLRWEVNSSSPPRFR